MTQRPDIQTVIVRNTIRYALLPALLFLCVMIPVGIACSRAEYLKGAESALKVIEGKITDFDRSNRASLQAFCWNKSIQETFKNPGAEAALMMDIQHYEEAWPVCESLAVGMSDGRMYSRNFSKLPLGYDPRSRDWYKDAVAAGGAVTLSDVYEDAGQKGRFLVSYGKAVYRSDGGLIGVAATETALEFLKQLTDEAQSGNARHLMLMDAKGRIIVCRDPGMMGRMASEIQWAEALLNVNGTQRMSVDSEDSYVITRKHPSTGWTMAVIVPVSGMSAQWIMTAAIAIGFGIVLLSTVALAGRSVGRQLKRSMQYLLASVRRAVEGNWEGPVVYDDKAPEEMVTVAKALDVFMELQSFRNSVINNSEVWISIQDNAGRPVLWNAAAEQFSGISETNALSEDDVWRRLCPPDRYPEDYGMLMSLILAENTTSASVRTRIETGGAEVRHMEWTAQSVRGPEGAATHHLLMGIDATERVQARQELVAMNRELEERVMVRTASLDAANEKLRESLRELERKEADLTGMNARLKESLETIENTQKRLNESEKKAAMGILIAGLTDEINTPLGVGITLSTYQERMLSELGDQIRTKENIDGDLRESIAALEDTTRQISRSMKAVAERTAVFRQLTLDQVEGTQRQIALRAFTQNLLEGLKSRYPRIDAVVTLQCDPALKAMINTAALSQIISNLMSNAWHNGLRGLDSDRVSIRYYQEQETICLIFEDNGVPMAPERIRSLFQPFVDADSHRIQDTSLHLVRQAVEIGLEGTLEVESSLELGSRFQIRFPAFPS